MQGTAYIYIYEKEMEKQVPSTRRWKKHESADVIYTLIAGYARPKD